MLSSFVSHNNQTQRTGVSFSLPVATPTALELRHATSAIGYKTMADGKPCKTKTTWLSSNATSTPINRTAPRQTWYSSTKSEHSTSAPPRRRKSHPTFRRHFSRSNNRQQKPACPQNQPTLQLPNSYHQSRCRLKQAVCLMNKTYLKLCPGLLPATASYAQNSSSAIGDKKQAQKITR